MTLAKRLFAAAAFALSLGVTAASCTSVVGDFNLDGNACFTSFDCTPPASECAQAVCGPDHLCHLTFIDAGTTCTPGCASCGLSCSGHPGCGTCDGAGSCFECVTPDDCFFKPGECTFVQCVNHACVVEVAPTDQKCSKGVCTPYGDCHQCAFDTQCAGGLCVKETGVCCLLPAEACTVGGECCSGQCTSGACACLATGQHCLLDAQCCSNNCPTATQTCTE